VCGFDSQGSKIDEDGKGMVAGNVDAKLFCTFPPSQSPSMMPTQAPVIPTPSQSPSMMPFQSPSMMPTFPDCPAVCGACRAGGDGGIEIVNGKCLHWCSQYQYCGTALKYQVAGTDCSGCANTEVTVGNEVIDRDSRDAGVGMQFVSEYQITGTGSLTMWKIYSSRSDTVVLQVWRRVGDSLEFNLVGSSSHSAHVGFNQFEDEIYVQSGDYLGWFCAGKQPIKYTDNPIKYTDNVVRRIMQHDGSESSVDLSGHPSGWTRTYSIQAIIKTRL